MCNIFIYYIEVLKQKVMKNDVHKTKTWRLNRMTLENMSLVLGVDTIKWLSVVVELRIMNVKGKDCVVGYPMVSTPKE